VPIEKGDGYLEDASRSKGLPSLSALHWDGIVGVADHVPAGAIAAVGKDRVAAGNVFFRMDSVDFVIDFVAF
jgi:hypothetical protein